MSNIFFSSDLHFNHKNIIHYNRGWFSCIDEMNKTIVENWNNKVSDGDTVYLLGDVLFGDVKAGVALIKQLNGNIHLIRGNHDDKLIKYVSEHEPTLFASIQDYLKIKINKKCVVMMHYPIAKWEEQRYGSFHVHGHTHGMETGVPEGRLMDVGLDAVSDFSPISLDDVTTILKWKPFVNRYEQM